MRCAQFFVSVAVLSNCALGQVVCAQCRDWFAPPTPDPFAADSVVQYLNEVDFGTGPQLVASGGFETIGGVAANRNAVWNGTTWQPLPVPFPSNLPSIRQSLRFDDGNGLATYVVLNAPYNGDFVNGNAIVKWAGSGWQPVPNSPVALTTATVFQNFLYVGGGFNTIAGTPTENMASWNGTAWQAFARQGPGDNDQMSASVFDSSLNRVLHFTFPNTSQPARTWSFVDNQWTLLNSTGPNAWNNNPRPRMVFDSARSRVLLLGTGDLREWSNASNSWVSIHPVSGPGTNVIDFSATYDSARDRVVVFGGNRISPSGRIAQTWEYDGSSWTQISTPTSPSARQGAEMAYDAIRQRVVLFGGATLFSLNDTWEYDGTTWTQRTPPSGSPPQMQQYSLVFDAVQQGCLLVVKNGGGAAPNGRVWRWNGITWTIANNGDSSRQSSSYVLHDPSRRQVMDFGSERWQLNLNTNVWTPSQELRGTSGPIADFAVYPQSGTPQLHVLGTFGVARFSGTGWIPTSSPGISNASRFLEVPVGPLQGLYAGGSALLKWNGVQWVNVIPGLSMEGNIGSISYTGTDASQNLLLGGSINVLNYTGTSGTISITDSPGFYRWTGVNVVSTGGLRTNIGNPAASRALLRRIESGIERIYVGGEFRQAATNVASNLAAWGAPCAPPSIIQQISRVTENTQQLQDIVLNMQAIGAGPLTYSWSRNGSPILNDAPRISGATTPTLRIDGWNIGDFGSYVCTVTGPYGTAATNPYPVTEYTVTPLRGVVDYQVIDVQATAEPTVIGQRGQFSQAFLQVSDRVVYAGSESSGTSWGAKKVWQWTPAQVSSLISSGEPTPHSSTLTTQNFVLIEPYASDGVIFQYEYLQPPQNTQRFGLARATTAGKTPIANSFMVMPGNPALFLGLSASFSDVVSNKSGEVWFRSITFPPTDPRIGWWGWNGSSLYSGPIAQSPAPEPGITWTAGGVNELKVSEDGTVGFVKEYTRSTSPSVQRVGYWRGSSSSLSLLLSSEETLDATGEGIASFGSLIRTENGAWLMVSRVGRPPLDNCVLFVSDSGVQQRTILPGPTTDPNWIATRLSELVDAKSGTVLVRGTVAPPNCTEPCSESKQALLLCDPAGRLHPVWIQSTTPTPWAFPGHVITSAFGATTSSGVVLLVADSWDGSSTRQCLLGWTSDNGLIPLAVPGTQVNMLPGLFATVSEAKVPNFAWRCSPNVLSEQATFAATISTTDHRNTVKVVDIADAAAAWHPCPTFIVQPTTSNTVPVGGELSLDVQVVGTPTLSYSWYFNGQGLSDGAGPGGGTVFGASTDSLILTNVSTDSAGTYYCEASNTCGTTLSWSSELVVNIICDSIDFNNDTSVFDPIDIDAFLSVYGEGPCIPEMASCNDIDFNNDGSFFDPCDIDAFLLQFSEGPCTLCGQ